MTTQNHLHKYLATQLGGEKIVKDENGKKCLIKFEGYPIFKCAVPNCTHYLARNLALGRKCQCWRCKEPMEMKVYHLTQVRPHHRECNRAIKNSKQD